MKRFLCQPSQLFKSARKRPLHLILVVPFVFQIAAAVGLTGWFSLQNGQKAVNNLAAVLRHRASTQITTYLEQELKAPQQINQINLAAIRFKMLNLQDFQQSGRFFWQQMQVFPVGYVNFANPQGEFIGIERLEDGALLVNERSRKLTGEKLYVYTANDRGDRLRRIATKPYDPRTEAWYSDAVKAGKPLWTQIYQWEDKPEMLSISASYPVYDRSNQLLGVLGVDLILSQLSDFLQRLEISPSSQTFILERNGLLVASSSHEPPFKMVNGAAMRLKAVESTNPLIRSTAQFLGDRFPNLQTIQTNQTLDFASHGNRQFVHITPWRDAQGLDWLVVVVLPESDFMEAINANTRTTILLCLLSLAFAILFGLLTARWISQRLQRLVEASRAIAAGDLNQTIAIKGIDELENLSQSFNQMAEQLKASFNDLEIRVAQRTAALAEAKEAAEAANLAKNEFLATMSHELRTPLNAILGFAQVMQHDSTLSPEHQENLNTISRSGRRLLRLINNILKVSKLEDGKIALQENPVNLDELLDTLKQQFQARAVSKGLQLVFDCAPDGLRHIQTDKYKLRQILTNLLENALKFTQQGRVTLRVNTDQEKVSSFPFTTEAVSPAEIPLELTVSPAISPFQQHPSDTYLRFEVEDTGSGIAPTELTSKFEPFTQTESGRQAQQGTGLGLYLSNKFANRMGGTLTCQSILEQGTIFTLVIPVKRFNVADEQGLETSKVPESAFDLDAHQDVSLRADDLPVYLAQMPAEWLEKLHQAAIKGSDCLLLQLIDEIPATQVPLANNLKVWVKDFQFDRVINLIQQTRT